MPKKPTEVDWGKIEKRVEKSNRISEVKNKLEDSVAYNEPVALTPGQSKLLLDIVPWYQG